MNASIIGIWISKDSKGKEVSRYSFSAENTYRCEERMDDNTWQITHQGQYKYAEKMLSLQYGDGIWYNMGYVGVDEQHMVQGFRRTASGEGIEGTWRLDSSGLVFRNMQPRLRDHRITVNFAKGVMSGTDEYIVNGQSEGTSSFKGKYTLGTNNTIVISEADNVPTLFLENGQKTVYIIDDVLCPVDDITIASLFTRVPSKG